MYSQNRTAAAIKDIENYFEKLEEFKDGRVQIKELEDPKAFHASAMMCLAIINRTIDIASDILVNQPISMPSRYKEIFTFLANNGTISKELGTEMEELVEHRNYLAHEYFGLDDKRMSRILRKVNFVKEFIERVKKHVAREESR